MFEPPHKPTCTWTYDVEGRGYRREITELGFYVIEHVATGKIIVGYSKRVSADVDEQIAALMGARHPNKRMTKLVESDLELKLLEYPAFSIQAAKDAVRKIKRTVTPTYLLMNP
jgi:hypothetical protein